MVWPRDLGKGAVLTIVALFGTTISPYLFFWQSSQEAEEIATDPEQKPLKASSPAGRRGQYRRIRFDTLLGMALSNLIALAIMLATAATLNARGITEIQSASEAARGAAPGRRRISPSLLFAVGIIGTGLLAVPVLAGSAAFAVGETRSWKIGLEYQPSEAARFYAIIVVAIGIGVLLDWSNFDPMKALFWSAVLNGIAAVPIMAAMMVVASSRKVMGSFAEHWPLLLFGWAATAVMAAASARNLRRAFHLSGTLSLACVTDAMRKFFSDVASKTAVWMGQPGAFIGAVAACIVWAVSGPIFHYSDTWQLVINTARPC